MSHLTLLAPSSPSTLRPALAHDIRNAMAVIALNVEKLEHLAGPSGGKAASAAHQLLMKVTALCNDLLRERANEFAAPRRTSFDIVETIRQVIDILRPITPADLKIKLHPDYRHVVFGNPNDVFRIVFNLAHNVVTLARLSGDQFALIIMSEKESERIIAFVETLRRALRAPISFNDREIFVTASMGIALGAGLAMVIKATTPMPTYVAPWSIAVGVLIGAGVGIISGVYPASRASLLDPVAALRQE